jgi:hypothetical protein
MSRAFTAGLLAQIQAASKRLIILFEAEYTGGFVRVWTGIGPFAWNGQTWTGLGDLLGFSPVIESTDTIASGFKISLSGVPTAIVAANIGQARRGLSGKAWLGALDDAGALVADPYQFAGGQLDQPEIDEIAGQPTLTVSYENRLVSLARARERRFDPQDQRIDFPTDKGFDYVPGLQDWDGGWGIPGPPTSAPGGGISQPDFSGNASA